MAVTDFGDGAEAWDFVQNATFDLLLTDIVMPGMDGIELAKRAVDINAALKVMFITGFAAVALHPSSGAPKQAKVLSKPFHLREIVAEVDRMLAAALGPAGALEFPSLALMGKGRLKPLLPAMARARSSAGRALP